MATIAVFVALGGSSYATVQISAVRKSSITSSHVKDSSLTGRDVKDRSLTGDDLLDGSLGGADVARGSLLATHLKRGELPVGPRGLKGERGEKGTKGDPGPPGLHGYVRAINVSPGPPGDSQDRKELTVLCPGGKRVIGGGGATLQNGDGTTAADYQPGVAIDNSLALDANTWYVSAHEIVPTSANWWLEIHAVCANTEGGGG